MRPEAPAPASAPSTPLPPDHNLGPLILGIAWASTALAAIVVALRLITRGVISRNLGWDDHTIAIGQVGLTVLLEDPRVTVIGAWT